MRESEGRKSGRIRLEEDLDFCFAGAEELLGAFEGVSGGEVRVAWAAHEDVVAADGFDGAGAEEDSIDVFGETADEEVAAVGVEEADEVFDGHDAGGVEVSGIAEAEDDDAEIFVACGALDLGAEDLGGAEEEFAFDVDDGDARVLAVGACGAFAEGAFVIEFVFDEDWSGGLAEIEGDAGGDAEEEGGVEREEERGEEGDGERDGVAAGGAPADAEVAEIEEGGGDADDEGGECGSGDGAGEVAEEEGGGDAGEAAEETADGGAGSAGEVEGGSRETAAGGHATGEGAGGVGEAAGEELSLIHI